MNVQKLISLVFFILQSSNISAQDKTIIGDWYYIDNHEYFEINYREDERVYIYFIKSGPRLSYYKVENDSLYVKLSKSETKYKLVGKIVIKNNQVKITNGDILYNLNKIDSNIKLSMYLDGTIDEYTYVNVYMKRKKHNTHDYFEE